MNKESTIPLRKSRMPELVRLKKYLKHIDQTKNYSNRSDLVLQFEERISDHLGLSDKNVIALSSGFSALTLGIKLLINNENKKRYCVVPSFTFPGTISSILFAGLEPYFIDISPNDFCLSAESLKKEFKGDFSDIACVVPVGTFGIRPDINEWELFENETNIKVFYDLAWNFDNYPHGKNINSMISLHASKVLGCGEGGIITLEDANHKSEIIRNSNFGLGDEKKLETIGINAKMSEYHAAVGLAAMDIWDTTKKLNIELQEKFINFFDKQKNFSILKGLSKDFCWMSCVIYSDAKKINYLEEELAKNKIESRRWWGNLCHESNACQAYSSGSMNESIRISKQHINIPFFADMSHTEIEKIFKIIEIIDNDL